MSRSDTSREIPAGSRDPSLGPSLAAQRARRLLAGGLLGAHVTALICIGIFTVRDGAYGLASAALAAALVVLFYTVGKTVQVRWADAPASTLFRVSLVSYFVRVGVLTALLAAYFRFGDETPRLLAAPMVITAVATVVGWLVGELIVFSRLRIPNFDESSQPADDEEKKK